jgi:hypothetical protein
MKSGFSRPCSFLSADASAEGENRIVRADLEENHHEDPIKTEIYLTFGSEKFKRMILVLNAFR